MQIPQQHCRAGPSRGQAHHAPDTRLQGLSLCANHFGWRRAYAHDPQRADARRRERSVRSSTILHAGRVTTTGSRNRGETVPSTLTRVPLNATEPKFRVSVFRVYGIPHEQWRDYTIDTTCRCPWVALPRI